MAGSRNTGHISLILRMDQMRSAGENSTDTLLKIHKELSSCFLYTHSHINATTEKNTETASLLYALTKRLNKKEILIIEGLMSLKGRLQMVS